MGPTPTESDPHVDLFRSRLANLFDQNHELAKLAELINWEVFDWEWDARYEDRGGTSALRTRMVARLHHLKHIHKLSDEQVVARWMENPYWQYFCGETYFQPEAPCHPTSLTRWCKFIGGEGCEWQLMQTIEAATGSNALKRPEVERVTVDSTVQERSVTFPTESKLLGDIRRHVVKACEEHRIALRQHYNRIAKRLGRQISGYLHAKHYRRMRKAINMPRRWVGHIVRDIERQLAGKDPHTKCVLAVAIDGAQAPGPEASRLERALQRSRAGSGVHQQGKAAKVLRIWRHGVIGDDEQEWVCDRRSMLSRQSL